MRVFEIFRRTIKDLALSAALTTQAGFAQSDGYTVARGGFDEAGICAYFDGECAVDKSAIAFIVDHSTTVIHGVAVLQISTRHSNPCGPWVTYSILELDGFSDAYDLLPLEGASLLVARRKNSSSGACEEATRVFDHDGVWTFGYPEGRDAGRGEGAVRMNRDKDRDFGFRFTEVWQEELPPVLMDDICSEVTERCVEKLVDDIFEQR